MKPEYHYLRPPQEVFLNPIHSKIGCDTAEAVERAHLVLPPEGGMLFFADPEGVPFHGFPFPLGTLAVANYKRIVMEKIRQLRNPLTWFLIPTYIRELQSISEVFLARYYLKPQYYSRPVREIYRVATLILGPGEEHHSFAHDIAMVFEFDAAYRYRLQRVIPLLDKTKDPKAELLRLLKRAKANENPGDKTMSSKWNAIERAFSMAWYIPKVRNTLTSIVQSIRPQEFEMDRVDFVQAHEPQRN